MLKKRKNLIVIDVVKILPKKKLLEGTILKCIRKMSIQDLQRYKCDECGKHFTLNIGLKGYITAVHEKKIQL